MVHYEHALPAEFVPGCKRRANGAARITGRRLDVNAPKRRHSPHLAVGDRVHGTTPGQREVGKSATLPQHSEEMEERLFVQRLGGSSDIAMFVLKRICRLASRP